MKFELPSLPYAYDALEPIIDQETMHLHHDKHHQTYVDNLNKLVDGVDMKFHCVHCVLNQLDKFPEDKKTAVRNNAGGVANHNLYWEIMTPGGSKEPVGELKSAIEKSFASFEDMKEKFEAAGLARFGSGWVWLVVNRDKALEVTSTPNQDHPSLNGQIPVLGNDVWEHAYYLKYQNRRAEFLKKWWDLVNWDIANEKYLEAIEN